MKGVFVTGWKEEIWVALGLMEPRDLEHVMSLAQRIEERNWALGGRNEPKIGGKPNLLYHQIKGAAEFQPRKLSPAGDYNLSPTSPATRTVPEMNRSSSVPLFHKEGAAGPKPMETGQSRRGNSY